jgi:hypothetical protein
MEMMFTNQFGEQSVGNAEIKITAMNFHSAIIDLP